MEERDPPHEKSEDKPHEQPTEAGRTDQPEDEGGETGQRGPGAGEEETERTGNEPEHEKD